MQYPRPQFLDLGSWILDLTSGAAGDRSIFKSERVALASNCSAVVNARSKDRMERWTESSTAGGVYETFVSICVVRTGAVRASVRVSVRVSCSPHRVSSISSDTVEVNGFCCWWCLICATKICPLTLW